MNRTETSIKTTETGAKAFTLVELLAVIAVLAIIAGLVVGLAGRAGASARRSRTHAQLAQIETAIESYKTDRGVYPPDNTNNAAEPQLVYELKGATLDPVTKIYRGDFPDINTNEYFQAFHRQGIVNSVTKGGEDSSKNYTVGFKTQQISNLVAASPVFLTVGIEAAPGTSTKTNTWRYVSTHATNNGVGRFDLWADIAIKGKTESIGNWNK